MTRTGAWTLLAVMAAGVLAGAAWALAAPAGRAFTDPENAGPDYPVQGEYVGTAGEAKLGCQIVALGNGSFQAVFLPGGLPGAGWDGSTRLHVQGRAEGPEVRFGSPEAGWRGRLIDGVFRGETEQNVPFELKKTVRRSPTLGLKPPPGAVVLFDGTTSDAWRNGKLTPDGLLQCGTRSRQNFGDFQLHFEFRTPFVPLARGQGRGNSGLYLQDRYEIQILDSFGLEGRDNECGGIYRQAAPAVNMCFPPLTWQTYDIDFQAARFDADGKKVRNAVVTVRHNGVPIHDRLELTGVTPGGGKRTEDATPGPFSIQAHGNPVVVRNVWVVPG